MKRSYRERWGQERKRNSKKNMNNQSLDRKKAALKRLKERLKNDKDVTDERRKGIVKEIANLEAKIGPQHEIAHEDVKKVR